MAQDLTNWKRSCLVAAMLCAATCTLATARADEADERFLEGLRRRQLFSLAVAYCRDRLAETELSDADRADLVIELARTHARHALNKPPPDRGPHWQAAQTVIDDFLRDHPQNARRTLVEIQHALNVLARGELARQETELAAPGAPGLDEARTRLREAINLLQKLNEAIAELVRQGHRDGPPAADEMTTYELLSLQGTVQYQLARAYRNQALCYPADSADRANSLTLAVEMLDPLARRETDDPLTWQARLDLVTCSRLLGDLPRAMLRVKALESAEPPLPVVLAVRAEKIRLELAAGRPDAALAIARQGLEIDGLVLPDLDYAVLETVISLWKSAAERKETEQAKTWQDQAAQAVRRIEQLHSPYWLRRAETLLAHAAAESGSGNRELLVRAAENFYRRGQFDDAVAQYDRAARQANAAGLKDEAFNLWFKAATIEHQRPRPREALQRFRDLALAIPDQPQSAKAHLLAIYNAATIARATKPAQVDEYQQLLTEHLDHWPTGSHADQARWWLGRLYEHQQRWPDALATYRKVSAGFPNYENSLRAVARCWEKQLSDMAADSGEVADEAEAAARWFENVVLGPDGRLPDQWTKEDRFAAVEAAKLWLTYTKDGFTAAKGVLDAALKASRDAPGQWQTESQMLLVVALAGLNRRAEAMQVLGRLSGGEPSRLTAMVSALDTLRKQAPTSARRDLAKLQLEALSLAKSMDDRFSVPDRNRLEIVRAEALAETGAYSEARNAYQKLAAAHPDDGQIQAGYAQLLMESGDRGSLQSALNKWREVAQRSPTTSDRWYQAKYNLALTHYQLGDKQRAAKLIQYLETLHPDLGGDEWRNKFQKLLARSISRAPTN